LPDCEGNPVEGEGGVDGTADGQPVEEEGEGGVVAPTTCRLAVVLLGGGAGSIQRKDSVADPIRGLFDPWIRDPGSIKSQDPDPE
jgi:hypothetical protein